MFEKEAEDKSFEKYPLSPRCAKIDLERNLKYEEGFKDGAEFGYNKANEGHDLRKDQNDLPDNSRYVWTNVGAGYHDDDGWWDDFGRLQNVVAWCEPKFEEVENDND